MGKHLASIRFLEKENAALTKLVAELRAELAVLRDENVELRAEVALLRKHSGNSSKPPSSDRVKPPKDNLGKRKKSRRKIGAQNGHPKHDRIHFTDESIQQSNTNSPSVVVETMMFVSYRIACVIGRRSIFDLLKQVFLRRTT